MADTLVDKGLGVMVAVIVIGAVAIPTVSQTLVLDTNSVSGDDYQPSDSLPSTFQVTPYEDGLVEDSETLYLDKSGDNSNLQELTNGDDYNVSSYEDGKFTLKAGGTNSQNYNTSNGDQIQANYDYKPTGYIGGTANTILGFIKLALALALFVAAISLVRS